MFCADRYFKLRKQSLSEDLLLLILVLGFAKTHHAKQSKTRKFRF